MSAEALRQPDQATTTILDGIGWLLSDPNNISPCHEDGLYCIDAEIKVRTFLPDKEVECDLEVGYLSQYYPDGNLESERLTVVLHSIGEGRRLIKKTFMSSVLDEKFFSAQEETDKIITANVIGWVIKKAEQDKAISPKPVYPQVLELK